MHYGKLSLVALLFVSATAVQAQTFDFEGATATSNGAGHPGGLTTLTQTSGGVTATFSRPGSAFDIVDTTTFGGGFPASFGARSLDPFTAQSGATPFVVDFSAPVSSASLDFGDFGADSDTMTLNAYSGLDGTGTLLATASNFYGTQSFPIFERVSLSAANIESITFIGGSASFPNSLYYDNLRVTAASMSTPEPGSVALLVGMSLSGAGFLARRRKNVRQTA